MPPGAVEARPPASGRADRARLPRGRRDRSLAAAGACAALLVLAACGKGPTDPPDATPEVPSLAGTWSGTMTWLLDTCAPLHDPATATLEIAQSGRTLTIRFGTLRFEGEVAADGTFETFEATGAVSPASAIRGGLAAGRIVATVDLRSGSGDEVCLDQRRLDLTPGE